MIAGLGRQDVLEIIKDNFQELKTQKTRLKEMVEAGSRKLEDKKVKYTRARKILIKFKENTEKWLKPTILKDS